MSKLVTSSKRDVMGRALVVGNVELQSDQLSMRMCSSKTD